MSQTGNKVPRDALVIAEILKSEGVEEYDPRVINQLLEFQYRHVKQVLDDGYDYKEHAGKAQMDVSDVHLAMKNILSQSFTQPPPPQLLHSLYQERNKVPLDVVPTRFGVLLPPNKHCLTSANYHIQPEEEE